MFHGQTLVTSVTPDPALSAEVAAMPFIRLINFDWFDCAQNWFPVSPYGFGAWNARSPVAIVKID
jgi:hypothetical protein